MSPRVTVNNQVERRSSFADFREERLRGIASAVPPQPPARSAWWKYATNEPLSELEHRTLMKGSNTAGGYLVPQDFEDQVVAVARDRGTIAKLAKEIVTTEGRTLPLPEVVTHGAGAWTSENASAALTDDVFGLLPLGAYKAETMSLVSDELLRDAGIDLAGYMAAEFGGRIAALEGTAFVLGDGSAKPQGALANFPIYTAPTGNTTSFSYTAILAALHTVSPIYRQQGGAWVGSDGILHALRQIDTAGSTGTGFPIIREPLTAGDPPMLAGYPFYVDTNMLAPAAGAQSLMFAGWQAAYVIRRVAGIATQRYNELYAANGQVGFKLIERVDGRVLIAAAGIALTHSAT
ncbi:MAG TPA: phage major capsid protein [Gaiellaceae bacterium]|nr:phage major capsid protein [Gaiellaceae bacterium]